MKWILGCSLLLAMFVLSGCGCAGTRCPAGWTYTYSSQGPGSGQWVVVPVYSP